MRQRHAHSKVTHFLVTLEYYKPKVIIVKDTGRGFAASKVPLMGTARSDGSGGERYGGYGLSLLEGLSDKVDFSETDPQGTTGRVEKSLRYETQADADEASERDTRESGVIAASAEQQDNLFSVRMRNGIA